MFRHDVPSERLVFLLGAPRSGTSWMGKIFDSHPDVIYRHEPDLIATDSILPSMCLGDDAELHKGRASRYIEQLTQTATVKTVGSPPLFRKRNQSRVALTARKGAVLLFQVALQLGATRQWARNARIPDFLPGSAQPSRIVIKSISALGRVRLFANAAPEARIALIVRDPRAQVASVLRGISLSKFDNEASVDTILLVPQSKRYGLTKEQLSAMTIEEKLTWNWVIMYEKALADLAAVRHGRIVRYDDFVKDPLAHAREILDFAGLSWNQQTEDFILESTRGKGKDRYYGVFKDPNEAANSWRQELNDDQKRRIRAIVEVTPLASFLQE